MFFMDTKINKEKMNNKKPTLISENNLLIKYLIIFVLFILNIFCLFSLTNYLGATVTNKFFNILINIGPILCFIGCLMFVWILFYNFFFKESKKLTYLILMGVDGLLFVVAFIFFMVNYSYLENCFLQSNLCPDKYFLLGFFLTIIMLIVLILAFIYRVIKKVGILVTLNITYNYKIKSNLYVPYLAFTFLASYLLYSLFILSTGALTISYPLEAVFLMFIIVTVIIDWIYFLCYFLDKKKITSFIMIGLNSIILILFVIFEILEPGFLIHVLKPIAPIDFAASIPVLYYLFIISLIVTLVFSVIKVVRKPLIEEEIKSK